MTTHITQPAAGVIAYALLKLRLGHVESANIVLCEYIDKCWEDGVEPDHKILLVVNLISAGHPVEARTILEGI